MYVCVFACVRACMYVFIYFLFFSYLIAEHAENLTKALAAIMAAESKAIKVAKCRPLQRAIVAATDCNPTEPASTHRLQVRGREREKREGRCDGA